MDAADVAAFMMAEDDEEQPPAPPAKHAVSSRAPPAKHAAVSSRALPPPPPAASTAASTSTSVSSSRAPPPARPVPSKSRPPVPSPPKEKEELRAQDVRRMLEEPPEGEQEAQKRGNKQSGQERRFEPLSSALEDVEEPSRPRAVGGGAHGGGFASVVVVGTEERAETMEEKARTFVAYRIEAQREGGAPFVIYRRYKQFETLHSRCRQHGMAVGKLPERRAGNWFGLRPIDETVVAERVPQLQSWLLHTLSLPQAATCKFLQEWLSPVQLGDISEKKFAKLINQ